MRANTSLFALAVMAMLAFGAGCAEGEDIFGVGSGGGKKASPSPSPSAMPSGGTGGEAVND